MIAFDIEGVPGGAAVLFSDVGYNNRMTVAAAKVNSIGDFEPFFSKVPVIYL
jgi:hypothetical protein